MSTPPRPDPDDIEPLDSGPNPRGVDIAPRAWRRAACTWTAVALVARGWQIASEPGYVHPDALYQALEPAFRVVWGHGVVAWEFREGLRSWSWPGLLAIPMAVCKWFGLATIGHGRGMAPAIASARALVAWVDVVALLFAARLAWAFAGASVSWGVALLIALHPAFAVVGAQPLAEVPASAALLGASALALAPGSGSRRHARNLGIALAMTMMLRMQLIPAVVVLLIAIALRSRQREQAWDDGARLHGLLGALIVLAAFGLLDTLTWGSPFQPAKAYLAFNLHGGATGFGVMPADRYARDFVLAFPALWFALIAFGGVAIRKAPWVVAVVLAVVLPHQALDHREWRFLHPAMHLLIALAGIGVAVTGGWIASRSPPRIVHRSLVLATVLASCGTVVLAYARSSPWTTTWLFNQGRESAVGRSRGLNRAMLVLSAEPAPTAIVQAVLPGVAAPGAALLGHDVPVFHVLGHEIDPRALARADVWIVGPEVPVPPDLEIAYEDVDTNVRMLVRPRAIETPRWSASEGHSPQVPPP